MSRFPVSRPGLGFGSDPFRSFFDHLHSSGPVFLTIQPKNFPFKTIRFQVGQNVSFRKVLELYRKELQSERELDLGLGSALDSDQAVQLFFQGEQIQPDDTPQSLEMSGQELIMAILKTKIAPAAPASVNASSSRSPLTSTAASKESPQSVSLPLSPMYKKFEALFVLHLGSFDAIGFEVSSSELVPLRASMSKFLEEFLDSFGKCLAEHQWKALNERFSLIRRHSSELFRSTELMRFYLLYLVGHHYLLDRQSHMTAHLDEDTARRMKQTFSQAISIGVQLYNRGLHERTTEIYMKVVQGVLPLLESRSPFNGIIESAIRAAQRAKLHRDKAWILRRCMDFFIELDYFPESEYSVPCFPHLHFESLSLKPWKEERICDMCKLVLDKPSSSFYQCEKRDCEFDCCKACHNANKEEWQNIEKRMKNKVGNQALANKSTKRESLPECSDSSDDESLPRNIKAGAAATTSNKKPIATTVPARKPIAFTSDSDSDEDHSASAASSSSKPNSTRSVPLHEHFAKVRLQPWRGNRFCEHCRRDIPKGPFWQCTDDECDYDSCLDCYSKYEKDWKAEIERKTANSSAQTKSTTQTVEKKEEKKLPNPSKNENEPSRSRATVSTSDAATKSALVDKKSKDEAMEKLMKEVEQMKLKLKEQEEKLSTMPSSPSSTASSSQPPNSPSSANSVLTVMGGDTPAMMAEESAPSQTADSGSVYQTNPKTIKKAISGLCLAVNGSRQSGNRIFVFDELLKNKDTASEVQQHICFHEQTELKESEHQFSSEEEMARKIAGSVEGNFLAGIFSASLSGSKSNTTNTGSKIFALSCRLKLFTIQLESNDQKLLSSTVISQHFKDDVSKLPTRCETEKELDLFQQFVNKYGTHYPSEVEVGGTRIINTVNQSSTTINENEIKAALKASMFNVGGGAEAQNSTFKESQNQRFKFNSHVRGGNPMASSMEDWKASVTVDPTHYVTRVNRIETLFGDSKRREAFQHFLQKQGTSLFASSPTDPGASGLNTHLTKLQMSQGWKKLAFQISSQAFPNHFLCAFSSPSLPATLVSDHLVLASRNQVQSCGSDEFDICTFYIDPYSNDLIHFASQRPVIFDVDDETLILGSKPQLYELKPDKEDKKVVLPSWKQFSSQYLDFTTKTKIFGSDYTTIRRYRTFTDEDGDEWEVKTYLCPEADEARIQNPQTSEKYKGVHLVTKPNENLKKWKIHPLLK